MTTPSAASSIHAPCGCKACRHRSIRARLNSPTIPPRTKEQWEVWGDGEDLRHGIDRQEEAVAYAAGLSDEWRTVEIVCVRRTVTRVR